MRNMTKLFFGVAFAVLAASLWAQTNVAPAATNAARSAGMTLGATNEPTTITCQKWKYQYARNIVTFQGDVLAINPRATIRSDIMLVTLDQARSISNIIAEGHVTIITPNNEKAIGGHADYTTKDRRLIMTIDPKVEARGTLWSGDKITFILDDKGIKDIEVETSQTNTNRSQLIIYPEAQKKKEEKKDEKKATP